MNEELKDDYNLDALTKVRPAGDDFDMYVTPRFVTTYAHGYETLSTRITRQQVLRQELFIDVGAHYGYYSLLAAKSNPQLHGISIEPISENLRVLQKNLVLNHIESNRFSCINAAVSSQPGHIQFYKSEASDNGSIYPHPSSETLDHIDIATVCLDDVVANNPAERIFLKTDTDGHELEVLKGFANTLDSSKEVTILLEVNPKMMAIANTGTQALVDYLHDKRFQLFAIDDTESRFYPMDQADNVAMMESRYKRSYYNVLCIRQPRVPSVLFFSHSSALFGAERSLLDLVNGLTRRGVMCTAILPSNGPLRHALIETGCAVYVPPIDLPLAGGWWWTTIQSKAREANFDYTRGVVTDEILPEIGKLKPDIIFSQTLVSPWGALCAEYLKVPHALSVREYGELDHQLSFLVDFQNCLTALYQSSDAIFCITDDVKKTLFGSASDHKIDVVYGSIRMPEDRTVPPDANTTRNRSHTPSAVPTIGIFGSIVAGKGQDDLVQACIQLSREKIKLRCLLVGAAEEDDYTCFLKQKIQDSGFADRFTWSGFVTSPYELMKRCDIVVSCSRKEAFGRTLLEASLLGKPIVYANSGGPSEIFADATLGLSYVPGDCSGLAQALSATLGDPVAASSRANRARDYVLSRFNDDAYSGRICARLMTMVGPTPRPQASNMAVSHLMMESGYGAIAKRFITPKLYYCSDTGNFDETHTVYAEGVPLGNFSVKFALPDNQIFRLRFDPTDCYLIGMELFKLCITLRDGTLMNLDSATLESNGFALSDFSWSFSTLDPQVAVVLQAPATHVEILGNIRLLNPRDLLQLEQRQVAHLVKQVQQPLLDRVQALENSLSWRLAKPLRVLARTMHKGFGRVHTLLLKRG